MSEALKIEPRKIKWVDEARVLSNAMPLLFNKDWTVVSELLQNSRRAGAQHIDMRIDKLRFLIEDDGEGLPDDEALITLLCVGASGYSNKSVDQERPAGMGIYSLLGSARRVIIESGFGRVDIESEQWFNNPDYRDGIFDRIDRTKSYSPGLRLRAIGPQDYLTNKDKFHELLSIQPGVQTSLNGEAVKPCDWADHYDNHIEFEGCSIYWNDKSQYKDGDVIWYGHPIDVITVMSCVIVVNSGYPFQPRLPDRNTIIKDDQWEGFLRRLSQAMAVFYCAKPASYFKENPHMIEVVWKLDSGRAAREMKVAILRQPNDIDSDSEGHSTHLKSIAVDVSPGSVYWNTAEIDCEIPIQTSDKMDVGNTHETIGVTEGQIAKWPVGVGHIDRAPHAASVFQVKEDGVYIEVRDAIETSCGAVECYRSADLVLQFEDNTEYRLAIEDGAVIPLSGHENYDISLLVISDDPASAVTCRGEYGFVYCDGSESDSYETQEREYQKELNGIIDKIHNKVQLLKAMRRVLHDVDHIEHIHFYEEQGERMARVEYTAKSAHEMETFKVV
jgi:hypothetical protein